MTLVLDEHTVSAAHLDKSSTSADPVHHHYLQELVFLECISSIITRTYRTVD